MTSAHNLTRDEARERAGLIRVASYEVDLDLTIGEINFLSSSTVRFSCGQPGASTFIEIGADGLESVTLNGQALDIADFTGQRFTLPELAADNELTVVAHCRYSRTGEGLHRFVDPVDKGVYLYSQFETYDAHRMYACFDQPDLKATFTVAVTAPDDWLVIANAPLAARSGGRWSFATTEKMSTYITALIAGPYHEVRDVYAGPHGPIPLGIYCRRSLAGHLDADAIFEITRQGFDFYHRVFDYPYPFGKYDQLFVPEFNAGAMENAGAVTFLEDYVFRSKVTDAKYERRAETILHEMAHMWFGDLVTMRWWDDLWLNESFATFMSVLCQADATRWTNAWTTFCNAEKTWAYRQDQLPSTHPIAADAKDIETVKANFDGITYAKGASVLKQLVAWVGQEEFLAGLRTYFRRHEFANTSLADLLGALHEASGRDLSHWSEEWLATTGVNTLRAQFETDPEGTFTSFTILQEAPSVPATLRSHRVAIGLYDLDGTALRRRDRVELDVIGATTEVPKLIGVRQPDVVLLNDDDLTFAKIRLDPRSLATVRDHIGAFTDSLARALCWAAGWDMTRDAELPARDYLALVLAGIDRESDIGVVQSLLAKAQLALNAYGDPRNLAPAMTRLADACADLMRTAPAGSDLQLAFVTAFASAATTDAHVAVVRRLLAGDETLPGLAVDTDLRWTLLTQLVARGAAGDEAIAAELEQDRTAAGEKRAATARSSRPTVAAKDEAWAAILHDESLSNHVMIATIAGFWRPDQTELLRPYVDRFFAEIGEVWTTRTTEMAHVLTEHMFPATVIEAATIASSERYLDGLAEGSGQRRLIVEGRDGLDRALRARAVDSQS
ncbi:MAG TPA: aminopeptidase N [Mycobacteriales bacterium]|nr:aminopeptidase N [Mycobacteriales bacterium]